MTDQTTQSQQATPPAQSTADSKQNPLDVLEEILGESKKVAVEKQQEQQQAAAEQAQIDAAQQQMAVQRQQDQAQIQQQLEQLKTIEKSPEYQARLDQEEVEKAAVAQKKQETDGHEIRQLQHTKM